MLCDLCNKTIEGKEIIHSDTWQICKECYDDNFWCKGCGQYLDIDDINENSYDGYCKDCY